jgi:uncharacterized protein Yka (UPF0111/DUF47 family)
MPSILPRDNVFFEKFEKIGALIVEAAEHLKAMLGEGGSFDTHAQSISTLERESDEHVHSAIEHLHKTFVTPFDRQDILKLSTKLDDIMDMTDAASSRIGLYRPRRVMEEAREMTEVMVKITKQVAEMMCLLRALKKKSVRVKELALEINRLENTADELRREAVARLFHDEEDTKELIKWKDILEHMEGTTDRCEDVSNIVEGIVLEIT